ncbi:uncharacterized protein LOC129586586 [Paramacrobiotus metropolitanus]|uniref:uncharacterized protein LOC129586586 n=1 Tax=Paramacrobiotus metropolitanus TaxID=2943436 RepID=UPI0024461CDA|nr:uncharacterized protein LOC129586586 [Paramacrobiotus metropolitanus]
MPHPLFNNLDGLTTVSAGLFAGTAFYMSTQEVPAMRDLGLDENWRFFPYMYHRAFIAQGSLCSLAGVGSITHALRIINSDFDRKLWLGVGATFLAVLPYTFIVMVPTNNAICEDSKRVTEGGQSRFETGRRREMLETWSYMHLVRTIGSCVAFGVMVYGLARHGHLVFKQ